MTEQERLQDPQTANAPAELDEAELEQAAGGAAPPVGEIVVTKHTDSSSAG